MGRKWGESGEKIGKTEKSILELASKDPYITIAQLAEQIGVGTTSIENNISKLKEKGLLDRSGTKGGYWIVKI